MFWLPFSYEEDVSVLKQLSNLEFLGYDDKDKVNKILSDLSNFGFIEDSQRMYVDTLLNDYGIYV